MASRSKPAAAAAASTGSPAAPPPPQYFSIDVECVATGTGHLDRAPAWVALVNGEGKCLYNSKIALGPDQKLVSPLTPITGLKRRDLEASEDLPTLEEAQAAIKAHLPPDAAVIVGQSIKSDLEWMGLVKGEHYLRSEDIAEVFKTFNPRYGNTSYFSLEHEARTLLPRDLLRGQAHDPEQDAIWSVELHRRFVLEAKADGPAGQRRLDEAKNRLLTTRPKPSVAKQLDYRCDGVCMARFFAKKCICGQRCG